MKRMLLALAAAALPFSAAASPELATQWGVKASDLREDTASLISVIEASGTVNVPSDFETEIARFSMTASRLGSWIDGNGGPSDLGCIFRGMAEEGEVQLDALDTADSARETHTSLKRLAAMFSDAETIAVAAAQSAGQDGPAAEAGATSCAASADAARAALE
ncbi:hypothetical protein [Henriciella sp.]|uniref:hypothetical protein n=1 Tax=Henriciella sp. TaxID=1968823 RepID=UPI002624238B|nr:hypothetical protein [Henriciella sp.]